MYVGVYIYIHIHRKCRCRYIYIYMYVGIMYCSCVLVHVFELIKTTHCSRPCLLFHVCSASKIASPPVQKLQRHLRRSHPREGPQLQRCGAARSALPRLRHPPGQFWFVVRDGRICTGHCVHIHIHVYTIYMFVYTYMHTYIHTCIQAYVTLAFWHQNS